MYLGKTFSHILCQYPVIAGPHEMKMAQSGPEPAEEPELLGLETQLCYWRCGDHDNAVYSLVLLL